MADVQWQRPNDLRVDVIGRRFRSAQPGSSELSSVWDRPWFVPRGVDDSVRIFSDDFPATGALHPLASTGPELVPLRDDRRPLRDAGAWRRSAAAAGGGDAAAHAAPHSSPGRCGSTRRRAQVVRLTFRYVGTGALGAPGGGTTGARLAKARGLNSLANQIVSIDADLEYGLQEGGTGCRTAR